LNGVQALVNDALIQPDHMMTRNDLQLVYSVALPMLPGPDWRRLADRFVAPGGIDGFRASSVNARQATNPFCKLSGIR
jgi:hypothetical protein